MSDMNLDDELAALEKEVENESKVTKNNQGGNRNKYNNNMNYGNNNYNKINNYNQNSNYNNNKNPYSNSNNNYNNYNSNNFKNNNNYNQNNNYNNNYKNINNKNNFNNNSNRNNNPNHTHSNVQNMNKQNQNQNSTFSRQTNQTNSQHNSSYQQNQQQKRSQNQYQQKQQQSKVPQNHPSNQSKNSGINKEIREDIYPEKQEGMYHKLKEMKSLTVLEEEIALCDKIIAFKKKKGLDYDEWETKKDLADLQLNNTKTLIENGNIDFEAYKKMIIGELQYEKKILKFTEMDKKSKPYELKEIIRRINRRIDVIGKELTQNIDGDNTEEEKSQQKKEPFDNSHKKSIEPKISNNKNIQNPQKQNAQQKKSQPINQMPNDNALGPQDSEPDNKMDSIQNRPHHNHQQQIQEQPHQHQHYNKIPQQYIIQKKELVTDPKTGKQMYVMKNVVDPKYAQYLKQKQNQNSQNHDHHPQTKNPQQILEKKELVTDPKTEKQKYLMKNITEPKYIQTQRLQNHQRQVVNTEQGLDKNQNSFRNQKTQVLGEAKSFHEKPSTKIKEQNIIKENPQAQQANNEEIEKYKKYINALIKEYTEAKEYFKRNGQENLANKSREDLKILLYNKQKIDSGRHKEVKLSSLPKPITPEYIYGYSENERMQKFKLVLSQLVNDKNRIDQKMKSIFEKLQKLKKKEFEKAKDAVKPKLDELKSNKDKITKLIEALKGKFKDKWTPAPEYKKVMEEDKVEKVTYEGCKYGLNIKVGKTNYDKDNISLVILLEASKNRNLRKEIKLKQLGDFNDEFRWEFSGEEWNNIQNSFLLVGLYRQHTFSNDKKGNGKIDLKNLRNGTGFKIDCKIELESKRVEPIVNFIITPILPHGKKYYETITKEAIKITRIYPAFTGKVQLSSENSNSSSNSQNQDLKPKTTPMTQRPAIKNNNNPPPQVKQQNRPFIDPMAQRSNIKTNNNPPPSAKQQNRPIIDKSKFKPEELEDVDCIDNLNSLKVLEFKIKELELKIKKIDGRTPKELLQKKVKMNCKKKQLEEGMGDGTISPKEYMEFMRIQLEHDQLLAMFLKQNNEEEKMKSVLGRIVLIKKEMEELKKFMK